MKGGAGSNSLNLGVATVIGESLKFKGGSGHDTVAMDGASIGEDALLSLASGDNDASVMNTDDRRRPDREGEGRQRRAHPRGQHHRRRDDHEGRAVAAPGTPRGAGGPASWPLCAQFCLHQTRRGKSQGCGDAAHGWVTAGASSQVPGRATAVPYSLARFEAHAEQFALPGVLSAAEA